MSDDEKEEAEAAKESLKGTTEYLKSVLGAKVDKVAVSSRLTTSPSALVQPQWGMSPQMQRFMKAQAAATGQDDGMMGGMASNLEINPTHEVVTKLKGMLDEDGKPTSDAAEGYAELLFDVAAISSGYELSDPSAFAKRVVALMGSGEEGLAAVAAEEAAQDAPKEEAAAEAPKDDDKDDDAKDEDVPITPEVL